MPISAAGAPRGSSTVHARSLPIATPCSLTPCSSPHIHTGWEPSRAAAGASGTEMWVTLRSPPSSSGSRRPNHRSTWASSGGRSLALANSIPPGWRARHVAHRLDPTDRAVRMSRLMLCFVASVEPLGVAEMSIRRVVTAVAVAASLMLMGPIPPAEAGAPRTVTNFGCTRTGSHDNTAPSFSATTVRPAAQAAACGKIGANITYTNSIGTFTTAMSTSMASSVTNSKDPCNCAFNWSGHYAQVDNTGPGQVTFFIYS